ncbi:MAG: MarR family winged helix-turn-helix transcriptional regulator [Anaerolineales bacterium]
MDAPSDMLAREILDVVPVIMRTIRAEMHSRRGPELSVVQFRALSFLNRNPGASLTVLAGHLGLTAPTVSKMISAMVANSLVTRWDSSKDRRQVTLTLTAPGQALLENARAGTQARLVDILAGLAPAERETVHQAFQLLQGLFSPSSLPQPVVQR